MESIPHRCLLRGDIRQADHSQESVILIDDDHARYLVRFHEFSRFFEIVIDITEDQAGAHDFVDRKIGPHTFRGEPNGEVAVRQRPNQFVSLRAANRQENRFHRHASSLPPPEADSCLE